MRGGEDIADKGTAWTKSQRQEGATHWQEIRGAGSGGVLAGHCLPSKKARQQPASSSQVCRAFHIQDSPLILKSALWLLAPS